MPSSPTPRQVSPRSRIFQRAGKHSAALAFVLGGALMLAPAATWVVPAPAAMAQDDATGQEATGTEVIAQGIIKLPKGDLAWLINKDVVPGGEGAPVASFPVGFGLTDGGSVEVRDEDGGTLGVLDRGEGFFLPSGKGGSLVSRTADDADFFVILLVSGDAAQGGSLPGTVVGNPFAAPETRDVELELRRGVLSNDDEATVPVAASKTPSLMIVTGGTAQLTGPDGQPVPLGVGQFALLTSDVSVRSADGSPAAFVVASIGDAVTAGKSASGDGQAKTKTRTNNAGATAAGSSSGGRGSGGGGGGGGRATGGSANQGGASTGGASTEDQAAKDKKDKKDKKNKDTTDDTAAAAGTPAPVETPQNTTPATPSPVVDTTTDDTVDESEDDDIVIVDQDNTQVDNTDEQDASDPGTSDDDTQVVEVPTTDDGTTDTTEPTDDTTTETPTDEAPVTEDPVVDQTTGDDTTTDDTQVVDPNAVTQDPAADQADTDSSAEEVVVEQAAPDEGVVVEQTAPEETVVEQAAPEADQATSAGDAAPADDTANP